MEESRVGLVGQGRGGHETQHDDGRHQPARDCERARVAGLRGELVLDPVPEQHRRREREQDERPARQPLLTHNREMDDQVLERGVGPEGQDHAHGPDEVPDAPVLGVLGAPPSQERHDRDQGDDAAVGVQLGKVVGPRVRLETDGAAAQQVRHDGDEQFGWCDRARGGEGEADVGTFRDG